jgi:hypothetical protein
MTKLRNKTFSALIAGSLLATVPATAFAVTMPNPAERAACTSDAFSLCASLIPNQDAVVACLRSKKSQLSPLCRSFFNKI